jgi:indolepyruvate ferredoxin oxidoreductase beta subunit
VCLAPVNAALAAEVAEARTLLKGYGDTRRRGEERFAKLMALVPALSAAPAGAATFARLRKAALADEEGVALDKALAETRAEAAERTEPARTAAE